MWPIFIMGEERERGRERGRERRRESTLQDHVIYNKMRIALCLPENFPVCWPPGPSSLGFSRESLAEDMWCYVAYVYHGGMCFPHRESTSWNFPAKIENSLLPIPSFDMMSKFPGLNHSCRRRYMNKLKKGEFVSLLGISEWEFYHQNQKFSSPWEYLSFDIKKSRVCLLL